MEQDQLDRLSHGLKNYDPHLLPVCPRPVARAKRYVPCVAMPGFAQSLRVNPGRYCVSQYPTQQQLHAGCMRLRPVIGAALARPRTVYALAGATPRKPLTFGRPVPGLTPRMRKVGGNMLEVRPWAEQ